MNDLLEKYDSWLKDDGPAALVIREYLMPVEGPDGVLFPATFAASEDKTFKGGYNIDTFTDGKNICLIDSVGSQANRIEPLFARQQYAGLVPQIVIEAGTKSVNLLNAGHRAGDAIVRCSALQQELRDAFHELQQKGNAEPLAKIAPTSIVFGAWDSRDTQAKLPRLIASTIRAFDVRELNRSATYVPPVDYIAEKLIEETDSASMGTEKDPNSKRGFLHALASWKHGGVIATGGIRRDASLHLAALRLLAVDEGKQLQDKLPLMRYILGLALTAFTYSPSGYLRQGCNLVLDPDKHPEFSEVHGDGHRVRATVTHDDALDYAKAAALEFGVGKNSTVQFDKEKAKADISEESGKSKKKKSTKTVEAEE
jgi:CRISPR-associated protein Csb1